MLETFVPSRIRRTLLEHLLTHSSGRFYLRGLAKELSLPISPLRRELLRLERLGVLKAYDEANIRFYVVDPAHPQFVQLTQVIRQQTSDVRLQTADIRPQTITISHEKVERIQRALRPRLPLALAALSLVVLAGAALILSTYRAMVKEETRPASGEMRSDRWRLVPGTMGGFSSGVTK